MTPKTRIEVFGTSRRTSPRKSSNSKNNTEGKDIRKKKDEIQEKMKALSARNTKICVIVVTIYQIQACTNDIIHYNY